MKIVVAHLYGNTKEQVKNVTDILANNGYEIAYENEQRTTASIIEDVVDVTE